ncbi:MAG: hypothetical protein C5B60_05025 [Chloroflexi bacterium]|nr:MAG: hypothetical protein C5B60_05025 [Chloroflexota bacterium]
MNYGGPNSGGSPSLPSGKGSNPPNLADYSNEPKYDLATVVQIVRVRPMILWGWEQQFGIPSPIRGHDDPGSNGRRYSERDIVASLWLREQILSGVSPNEAAARLLGPLGTGTAKTGPLSESGSLSGPLAENQRIRGNSMPLGESGFAPRSAKPTRRLSDLERSPTSGPLAQETPAPGQVYGARPPITSGPLGSSYPDFSNTGRLPGSAYTSPTSGPGAFESTRQSSETSAPGVPWPSPGTGTSQPRGQDLRILLPQFIRAFTTFDTSGANNILNEALGSRSVETVCIGLLLPALTRIADLTARHEASTPEERFAVNYAKSFLFAVFHRTPERSDGPLALVGCGPKELSEINALSLAVFWRRAGLRVIYLGQDIEASSLIEEVRKRRPALVSLTIANTQRLRSLSRVAKALNQLDAPRPFVGFGGPIFVRNPELQRRVTGVYLGDDAATATWHVTNLLGTDRGTGAGVSSSLTP